MKRPEAPENIVEEETLHGSYLNFFDRILQEIQLTRLFDNFVCGFS